MIFIEIQFYNKALSAADATKQRGLCISCSLDCKTKYLRVGEFVLGIFYNKDKQAIMVHCIKLRWQKNIIINGVIRCTLALSYSKG